MEVLSSVAGSESPWSGCSTQEHRSFERAVQTPLTETKAAGNLNVENTLDCVVVCKEHRVKMQQ